MYYLPLFINQRRYHYCRMQTENASPLLPFHFIAEHHPGFQPALLHLAPGASFLSGKGTKQDIALKDKRLEASSSYDAHRRELQISFKVGEPSRGDRTAQLNKGLEKCPLVWQSVDKGHSLKYTGPTEPTTIAISISLHHSEEIHTGKLLIHIGASHQLFDAVFDFGSEASQIACKQRSQESRRDPRINMLDRLLFDYYAPALKEGRVTRKAIAGDEGELSIWNVDYHRYLPYDEEDAKLFRSSFLIRRSYENPLGWDASLPAAPFQEGAQEWISILGDNYDPRLLDHRHGDSYHLIPNLKLAELGYIRDFKLQIGRRLAHFSDANIHEAAFRRLMNQFLHLLLSEIDSKHPEVPHKLLRLTLLVPNIYSQRRIHKLLENLQRDFERIILEHDPSVRGLEIQTLSESDASFLGLLSDPSVEGMHQHQLKAGQHYLIIDIGKGTTDLSIMSTGEERDHFSSVFRSGFAGAGNALTYAFIETLATVAAGDPDSEERTEALKAIMEAEPAQKLELMRWVEKLKRRYSETAAAKARLPLEDLQNIRALKPASRSFVSDLNRILEVEFVRAHRTIDDYFGFLSHTIQEITSRAVALIQRSGVAKFPLVILSGRGFLLPELREAMQTALKEQFQIGSFLLEEQKLKTSCLYGPLNFPAGTNKNSDLVGTPVITEKSGLPAVRNLFFKGRRKSREKSYTEADLHEDDFYLEGQMLDLERQRITISGRELMLPSALLAEGDGEVNLLFVGHGFIARTPQGCMELQIGHEGHDNPLSDPLAWKSLFPYTPGMPRLSPALRQEEPPTEPEQPVSEPTVSSPWQEQAMDLEMLSISSNPVNREGKKTTAQEPPATHEDDMWDYL